MAVFSLTADVNGRPPQRKVFRAIVSKKALPANRKMAKDPDDPSINIYEVEAILLIFQL